MRKLTVLVAITTIVCMNNVIGMEQLSDYNPNQPNVMERDFVFGFGWNSFEEANKLIAQDPQIVQTWHKPSSGDACLLLHIAVENNNIQVARALLQQQSSIINVPTACNKYTPLHMVCSKQMAKLLLAHGADLESKSYRGATPLFNVFFVQNGMYSRYYDIPRLSSNKKNELAHYLIKKGANVNAIISNEGDTVLHQAVGGGGSMVYKYPDYVELLLRHNADAEYKNQRGETPYGVAIDGYSHCKGVLKIFKNKNIFFIKDIWEFLENGAQKFKTLVASDVAKRGIFKKKTKVEEQLADLFAMARDNSSPDKGKITQYHIGHCFNRVHYSDLQDWAGEDAIEYMHNYFNECCQQALCLALEGHYKELKDVVREHPFVLRYDKKIAFDVLHHMMLADQEIFSDLLDYNPDLTVIDEDGNTLLHKAVESKNSDAMELLIKHGITLFASNNKGQTAIDVVSAIGDEKCMRTFKYSFMKKFFATYSYQPAYQEIKEILKKGFDVNDECDQDGKLLLWKTIESYPEKFPILLKYGAQVTQEMIDKINEKAKYDDKYAEMCELLQKHFRK